MASQTSYDHQLTLRDLNRRVSDSNESNIARTGGPGEFNNGQDDSELTQDESLPPVDGGIDAWLFLAGCFVVEMLLWGFPFAFGVFQEYYTSHEPFSASPSGIPVVGTTASGVMYLGSPFIFIALRKWLHLRKWSNVVGLLTMVLALISSSFAQKVWHLILTQGVLYGVGGSLSYCPCILYMDEWFSEKTGLAFGIMWAGTGLGGLIIPFIMDWSLELFGFRAVLRAWAVVLIILLGPLIYYLKPRIPASRRATSQEIDFNFLRLRAFWIYQVPNIIQGLGYFIPTLYLPSYASAIGLPSIAGPLTVAIFNATLVLGTIVLGAQTDRLHVTSVILITTIGAALSVFILWGVSVSLPVLCLFSIVYGFFAGAFSTSWTAIIKEIQKKDAHADTGMVFGMFAAGRGIGNLASGPLSESLLAGESRHRGMALGYGTGYGALIVFVGATATLSGISWAGRRIGWV